VKLGAGVALRRHGVKEALFAPEVVALLSGDDPEARGLAAGALAGEEVQPADGDRLRASLRHPDWRVRRGALEALLRYGPEAAGGYAAKVAGLLKDPHEAVRGAVPPVLRHVGAAAAAELAAMLRDDAAGEVQDGEDLLQALCGGDRARADELLYGHQPSATASWASSDRAGRRASASDAAPAPSELAAARSLSRGSCGAEPPTGPEPHPAASPATAPAGLGRRTSLAMPVGHRFSGRSARAEQEVCGVPADPAAQLAMDELLRHPDPAVREAAALLQQRPAGPGRLSAALSLRAGAEGPELEGAGQERAPSSTALSAATEEAAPEEGLAERDAEDLADGLGSTSRVERLGSLRAMRGLLARLPSEAAAAHVPALVQALDDSDIEIRIGALSLLGEVGSADGEYVGLIRAKLQHPNSLERAAAASAAGSLQAAALAGDLAQLLLDPDATVRTAGEEALGGLGAEAAGEHAARWIRHESGEVRRAARAAMLHMSASDPTGPEHALRLLQPLVEPALTDKSAEIRGEAVSLLERLGLSGVDGNLPACFLVAQALSEDADAVGGRLDALRRLGAMGAEAAPYAAQLGGLLGDEHEQVRRATVECARRLGEFFAGAAPVAAGLLQSPLQGVRRAAVAV
ncbi:unnamed protein product, partial [Prorocentrum cordatum]